MEKVALSNCHNSSHNPDGELAQLTDWLAPKTSIISMGIVTSYLQSNPDGKGSSPVSQLSIGDTGEL